MVVVTVIEVVVPVVAAVVSDVVKGGITDVEVVDVMFEVGTTQVVPL